MRHWLSTPDGDLNRDNLKTLAAVFLALAGGLTLIGGSVYELTQERAVSTSSLLYMAGICVAPLIAGVAATGLKGRTDQRTARAIQSGDKPGRRAGDTAETATTEGAG